MYNSLKEWPADMDYHSMVEEFQKAFHVWSEASKLTFTDMRRGSADIEISFLRGRHGDEYPFDGPGAILGHAFFPGDDIGGDAHFDADEQWDKRRSNEIDRRPGVWAGVSLFSVAAHEFGHSLGLSHSSVSGSLMFPYYQTLDDNFRLPYLLWLPYVYFWWLQENRDINRAEPTEITHYWPHLPKDLVKVDAVYERHKDAKIVFFIGKEYYVFNNQNHLEPGYPKTLVSMGLPETLDKVDAVMIWGHNAKTYIFSGSQYWRFDEEDNRVELDYPRDMAVWKGIPVPIDAAFQWASDGHTYFFKGKQFWKFDNRKMQSSDGYPHSIGPFWFRSLHCRLQQFS
ncbi:unnamed protein product [Oppiella nova]|uniref:Peptidase metallopeptidase domain-containing protein n=1 Tax=Oppiella nova TaxID=334625 RepID=A0A7R9LCL7_9ACAR|nr:unnamed protein product [Oppiella nova]CAG2162260.1 unnamed protein product [Oppiella nova]